MRIHNQCLFLMFFFLFANCKREDRSISNDIEMTTMNEDYIKLIEERIYTASMQSIKDQINIDSINDEYSDRLESQLQILSDTAGIRNDFFNFLKTQSGLQKDSEMYLIEIERSGEVFEATNIIYFLAKDYGYKYRFERGNWIFDIAVKLSFKMDYFFNGLKYRKQCRDGDNASIDYLSISRIKNEEIVTKILIVLCKEDIPQDLIELL